METVKHGQTVKFYGEDVDTEEVELFCSQELAHPQVSALPHLAVVRKIVLLTTVHAIVLLAQTLLELEYPFGQSSPRCLPLASGDIGKCRQQCAGMIVLLRSMQRIDALVVLMALPDPGTSFQSTDGWFWSSSATLVTSTPLTPRRGRFRSARP